VGCAAVTAIPKVWVNGLFVTYMPPVCSWHCDWARASGEGEGK
jgi:hypothetical protein